MRFEGIRFGGLGPFHAEVEVDLSSVGGKIVAVTGGNGQGKSTFLELLIASLTRRCPTRGPLAKLAKRRDSFLETRFTNGSAWTLRHAVDSVSGEGDSVVLDADGKPAFDSAKRRAFDAWAAKHLPPPEVLLASVFTAQGSGGFLDMKAGERKAVVLRVLGIERLEALAETARVHAREAKAEAMQARATIAGIGNGDVAGVELVLAGIDDQIPQAETALAHAEARQERARQYATVRERIASGRTRLADTEERLANNAKILADAPRIQQAVADRDAYQAAIETLRGRAGTDDRLATANAELAAAREALRSVGRRQSEIGSRLAQARESLAGREVVAEAAARLDALRSQVAEGQAAEADQRRALDELQTRLATKSENRIGALRGHLEGIAGSVRTDSKQRAKAALSEDDATAALIVEGPKEVARRRAALVEVDRLLRVATAELTHVERLAARQDSIARAEEAVRFAEADLDAELATEAAAKSRVEAAEATVSALRAEKDEARAAIADLEAKLEKATQLAGRAKLLDAAEARIEELTRVRTELSSELAELERVPVEAQADYVGPARDALARLRSSRAVAEAALARAREDSRRIEELTAQAARASEAAADWTRLAEDLGRDGLQEAEIDCAAPELTALVNDLLHTCVGPRFTVTIEAQRSSADGKRELSGLEVRVLDTVGGREDAAETFSGGERVLIGEAVSLALTMLACRRSGATRPSIVRDESGAALDPANTRAWVAMLRRAAEVVGAEHVLFVSHSPEAQELADARIVIADGEVTIQ